MEPATSDGRPRPVAFGHHRRESRVEDLVLTLTHHRRGLRTPSHEHPWACLHYVLDGCYAEQTGGGALSVARGGLLFKPPEERHWNELGHGAWTLRVEIPPSGGDRDALLPLRSRTLSDPRAALVAERLALALLRDEHAEEDCGEALVLELLAEVGGRPPTESRRRAATLVARCLGLLDESRDRVLGLAEAARRLGVHRAHLARVFRAETGRTLGEYQRALRLRRALGQIRAGSASSLAEVACDQGFADQSHLTRAMRDGVGATPASVRALWS